jgi:hypothetical protein
MGGVSTNLTSDAVKDAYSVTVASTSSFAAGDLVVIDEINDMNRVWLSEAANNWFSRLNRNTAQRLEIASISGSTVTFTTPFHLSFRVAQTAQMSSFAPDKLPVRLSGVEDLYTYGGQGGDGGGNFIMINGMYTWLRNVESERSKGAGAGFDGCFRCEIRDSFIHTAQTILPASSEYMFQFDWGSSDNLMENNIGWNCGKAIVARGAGGGNVIGYNYLEDVFISDPSFWSFVESGLQAAHQATSHMFLIEGNQSFNFDSDITHGNSIYMLVFRNHFTGLRRGLVTSYDNHDGTGSHAITITDAFPRAAIRSGMHSWWFTFVGNVLGYNGMPLGLQTTWLYDSVTAAQNGSNIYARMWMLANNGGGVTWTVDADTSTLATYIRDGNWDWVTNSQHWDNTPQTIPNSLYLQSKPAFFGANTWPWVDPVTGTTYVLPARARFDTCIANGTFPNGC